MEWNRDCLGFEKKAILVTHSQRSRAHQDERTMNVSRCHLAFCFALVAGASLSLGTPGHSFAQDLPAAPPAPSQEAVAPPPSTDTVYDEQPNLNGPAVPKHIRPQMYYPQQRRSILQHYPYPYPAYYQNDSSAGFRNPGNVGRHAEYYTPGEPLQVTGDPVRVAQFGKGGYPSRSEQLQAQQVGINRYNSIQRHIDNYAMPHFGFGFGMGGFGGFW
jgi:hypothetical protein